MTYVSRKHWVSLDDKLGHVCLSSMLNDANFLIVWKLIFTRQNINFQGRIKLDFYIPTDIRWGIAHRITDYAQKINLSIEKKLEEAKFESCTLKNWKETREFVKQLQIFNFKNFYIKNRLKTVKSPLVNINRNKDTPNRINFSSKKGKQKKSYFVWFVRQLILTKYTWHCFREFL